jgi:hypothetical protein
MMRKVGACVRSRGSGSTSVRGVASDSRSRLDWRDPDMPVLRVYVDYDELGGVIARGVELVQPETVSEVAREDLVDSVEPNWHADPSYHWARRSGRRLR